MGWHDQARWLDLRVSGVNCPYTYAEIQAMATELLRAEGRDWLRVRPKTARKYRQIVVALWHLSRGEEGAARDVMQAVDA